MLVGDDLACIPDRGGVGAVPRLAVVLGEDLALCVEEVDKDSIVFGRRLQGAPVERDG